MKVFISWSGERSQRLAQGLRDWIPLVLHPVEPWLSKEDVAAGERWAQSVAKELESSNFGIICVTRENVTSPWILFEAGSLAKLLQGSRVIPLLLDLDLHDISGPLAQFQAKKVDEDGVFEVIKSINQNIPQPIPETRVQELFDALWPRLEKQISSIPKPTTGQKAIRPQSEIFEELVSGVRSLESRLRNMEEMIEIFKDRRLRHRFHPMMFEEISHMLGDAEDPIGILMAASVVRNDFPWLYELAIHAYEAVKSGDQAAIKKEISRIHRLSESMIHSRFLMEFGGGNKDAFIMSREFPMMLEEILQRYLKEEKKPHSPSGRKQ